MPCAHVVVELSAYNGCVCRFPRVGWVGAKYEEEEVHCCCVTGKTQGVRSRCRVVSVGNVAAEFIPYVSLEL